MSDQINQALQHIRNLLVNNTDFSALIASGSVMTGHPKTADLPAIPMPLVILDVAAGVPGAAGVPLQQLSLDVYVYSRVSQAEAFSVYEAGRALMNMARLHSPVESNGVQVNSTSGYMRESQRPSGGCNDQISAWYAKGQFIVYTATRL